MHMNDSWSVECLMPRKENIRPEVTESWRASGRYGSLDEALAWARQQLTNKDVTKVRVKHHQWSSEVVWEAQPFSSTVSC